MLEIKSVSPGRLQPSPKQLCNFAQSFSQYQPGKIADNTVVDRELLLEEWMSSGILQVTRCWGLAVVKLLSRLEGQSTCWALGFSQHAHKNSYF